MVAYEELELEDILAILAYATKLTQFGIGDREFANRINRDSVG